MIILDLSPEELKGLNLPCLEGNVMSRCLGIIALKVTKSFLILFQIQVLGQITHAGSECDAASDDSDSDYIPEHEHASSDFELSSVCSQGNFLFQIHVLRPYFKYTSVYEFQDEEEKEEQEYLEDEDEDVDGTGTLKTARTNNKQGRRWDKMNACKFCLWLGTGKLLLHLAFPAWNRISSTSSRMAAWKCAPARRCGPGAPGRRSPRCPGCPGCTAVTVSSAGRCM